MKVEDMHYEFRLVANQIDSARRRRFLPEEIDRFLNRAQTGIVRALSQNPVTMFEGMQFTLEDLRTLIVVKPNIKVVNGIATLPEDYLNFVRAKATIKKGECTKVGRVFLVQYDDLNEEDLFTQSSFEWEEINAYLGKPGLTLVITDFEVLGVELTYVKQPSQIAYGSYTLPSGIQVGKTECELPEHLHEYLVQMAVQKALISYSGSLPPPDPKYVGG